MLEILQNGASALGLTLNSTQLNQFQTYFEELVDWNSRMNLTAILEYEAVQTRHFLDSLTLASPQLRGESATNPFDMSQARLIDIGAGAGFPGLPLKIYFPQLKLTVVDSVGKKMSFASHIATKLGLENVQVLNARAEELGQQVAHREKYDVATGRAVAAWPVLAEYCLPLCKKGGLFIAPKKGDLHQELTNSEKIAQILGGKLRSTTAFGLPGDADATRRLVVTLKTGQTPATYPRRVGIPSAQPLK